MPAILCVPRENLLEQWLAPRHRNLGSQEGGNPSRRRKEVLLGSVADISSGSYLRGYDRSGMPYLRVDNVRHILLNLSSQDVARVSEERACRMPTGGFYKPRDLVVARTGTIGKVGLVTEAMGEGLLSQHVSRLRVKPEGPTPGTLALFLNSPAGSRQLIDSASGSTRLELTHSALSKIRLPGDFEKLNALGDRVEKLADGFIIELQRLGDLVQRAEDIVLGNGCPQDSESTWTKNFSVARSDLGDLWLPGAYRPELLNIVRNIEEDWETCSLAEIATVRRGQGTRATDYTATGTPYIRTSDIVNGYIDPFPDHYASEETVERYNQKIESGDILVSIEGKIGMTALLHSSFPVVFKNHIELVRCEPTLFNEFNQSEITGWLYLMLTSSVGQTQARLHSVTQSTIPGLASRLRQFRIPVCSYQDGIDSVRALGSEAYDLSARIADYASQLRAVQGDANLILEDKG